MKRYYTSLEGKSAPQSIIPTKSSSWEDSLDIASHRFTLKEYCKAEGYDYQMPIGTGDIGSCVYNKESCLADSNPHWVPGCVRVTGSTDQHAGVSNGVSCDIYQKPYLEWHNDKCVTSGYPPGFIINLCEAKGLGKWYQGTPICDSDGYCQINPKDPPTCMLTESYCDSMGLDYNNGDNGKGDCQLNDAQNIIEAFAGKTLTRTIKRNTEAMIKECGDNFFSANCALSISNELTVLNQILVDSVDKEFSKYVNNMKESCKGDIFKDIESFATCSANLMPGFFLTQEALKFVDGMLDGALGWIPGIPHGMLEKASGYLFKYGAVALNALYHAGVDVVVAAFDLAGDAAYYALDAIGLGVAGKFIKGALGNILKYGEKIANVIANVAKKAITGVIEIFSEVIAPAAYHVFSAVSDAVLNPVHFFSNVAKDVALFFTDPGEALSKAFKGIASIGEGILDAAKAVLNKLNNVLSDMLDSLGPVGEAIKKVISAIEDEVKDIANKIARAAEDIADWFESIF